MTQKQFGTSVRKAANNALKRLQLTNSDIVINWGTPSIAIGQYDTFFAQGESASELLETATKIGNNSQQSIETCLVYLLDMAGAI